jgi:transposase
MKQTNERRSQNNDPPAVSIGIDWADRKHDFHLIGPDGRQSTGEFDQDPAEIEKTVRQWRLLFPGARIEVIIEQSRGPLISALLKYDDVEIFPINPAQLASYRKAFAHGGGKNDPTDAWLQVQYLQHYRQRLRPLRQDEPLTRELAALCEDRRGLVDQRTKLANSLTALLKAYFPAVLKLAAAKIYACFLIKFLLKYPTLAEAKRAGRARLRKFFYGIGARAKAEERLDTILNAVPLSEEPVLIRTSARKMQAIARQIDMLNRSIADYDAKINELVKTHADYRIVASLPGASDKTQARIIAALGDDRSRWSGAESLQAAAGIAPITTQSGRQKFVSHRWACTKFMKQTFHEYAGLSIKSSSWAGAFYKLQLSRGKSSQMARRSLAYKWMRIIFRCWKESEPYDEDRYMQRLKANNSPLLAFLDT